MGKENIEAGAHSIFTVSQLTDKIKATLEENFPFVWITGEISNFNRPMSGHYYFTLKDDGAQISSVMFKGQNRNIRFVPEDGMTVTGLGRISLYKPRGTYQIIFEYLEPKGVGALQVAFEQLKARLSQEGLFDADRKRPIPFLPGKIALITSPTGAVLHDILKVARRRFENMRFLLIPVSVQGSAAASEIVEAIGFANRMGADVAIVARGGGSLEDLQPFNSEAVARAIFTSDCPIVSAVGHETDYTIADFVADLRSPTPSAAAELVIPLKEGLMRQIEELRKKTGRLMRLKVEAAENTLKQHLKDLEDADPARKIADLHLRCDEVAQRLVAAFTRSFQRRREQLAWQASMMNRLSPQKYIVNHRRKIEYAETVIRASFLRRVDNRRNNYEILFEKLHALSPLAVLERGYSITRTLNGRRIIKSEAQVSVNQSLEVVLASGTIEVTVNKKNQPDIATEP